MQPFVSALGTELGLTSKEIADIIWLALQMQNLDGTAETPTRLESLTSAQTTEARSRPAPEDFIPPTDRNEQTDRASQTKAAGVHLNQPSFGKQLALKVPDARSLREPLSLARSLKPLLRRVVTGWSTVLDDVATVDRIAAEQLWLPVLKPALEPWLDLALVVDESASMQLWQRTIAELQRLLSHYGVFRDVRVWGLVTDERGQVQLRPGLGVAARRQAARRPSELLDPSGRRLILVATDCVSPGWQDGSLLPALKLWATSGPLAIVQMLPEWLWSRTGLGFASAVRLQALLPGVPNQQLVAKDLSPWDEVDLEAGLKVPVVTLEPEPFADWTEMVMGKGGAWSPGFVFETETIPPVGQVTQLPDVATEDAAEHRVQRFRVTASPMARRLAGLLAAAPVISLPVVRIIQDRLLSESRQVHVAEVFLGGMLKPLGETETETNPDAVQYDFWDGVREALLESVPTSDSVNVLEEVSKFVAERLGLSLDAFTAVLRNPQQAEDRRLASQSRPFAMVTAQILRQLGGEYAQFAEDLERSHQSDLSNTNLSSASLGGTDLSSIITTPETKLNNKWHITAPPRPVVPLSVTNQQASEADEALRFVEQLLLKRDKRLNDLQRIMFKGAWNGKSYKEIHHECSNHYSYDHLVQNVGPELWKLLSDVLGERVSKRNLRGPIERAKEQRSLLDQQFSRWASEADEALRFVEQLLLERDNRLNDLQRIMFKGAWDGKSYKEIHQECRHRCSYEHLAQNVGPELWKLLSYALNEKVSKRNLRGPIEHVKEQRSRSELNSSSNTFEPVAAFGPRDETFELVAAFGPRGETKPQREDWSSIPEVSSVFGRARELEQLEERISFSSCCLILLYGVPGIGKTTLAAKLAHQISRQFEYVVWRSLEDPPHVQTLVAELTQFLSNDAETSTDLSRLLFYLQRHSCLIVLDGLESVLRSGVHNGSYREGYEGYSDLLRQVGRISHMSRIVLTSAEKPRDVASIEGEQRVFALKLEGLGELATQNLLVARGNECTETDVQVILHRYDGNPFALNAIANHVREVFDGDVKNFLEQLQQGTPLLENIRSLLDRQFNRLSDLERAVVECLVMYHEPLTIAEVIQSVTRPITNVEVQEVLQSLLRRSLIEGTAARYSLQALMTEYMMDRAVEQRT